jgi:hypothetical protein
VKNSAAVFFTGRGGASEVVRRTSLTTRAVRLIWRRRRVRGVTPTRLRTSQVAR